MISSGRTVAHFVVLIVLVFVRPVDAGIEVGGGSIALGGGTIDLGCSTLSIASAGTFSLDQGQLAGLAGLLNAGALSGGQGRFELSGQWNNAGNFQAGQSSVVVTDACSPTTVIGGESDFWNLSVAGITGPVNFASGALQRVANELVLRGLDVDQRLVVRSTVSGQPAMLALAPGGSQDIFHVNVRDNHAPPDGQALAVGDPFEFQSVDSGGNSRWFRDALPPPIPVSTLTPMASLLLLVLMLLFGLRSQSLAGFKTASRFSRRNTQ